MLIACVSIFSRSLSVRMYCIPVQRLAQFFDWICALQVFVIIFIKSETQKTYIRTARAQDVADSAADAHAGVGAAAVSI